MRTRVGVAVLSALCAVAAGGPPGDREWPAVALPRLAAPPQIDGRLQDAEWEGAVRLTGFVLLGGRCLAAGQPEVRAAWVEGGLAVGVAVGLPPGQKARAQATDWDGTVWQDDSVEVHLDPRHDHTLSYQFVVNALGTRLDSRRGDLSYTTVWEAAAVSEPGRWSAEFLIPWRALETDSLAPGALLGFNLAVNASHLGGVLTWAPVSRSLHEPAEYGHLTLGGETALSLAGLDARGPGVVEAAVLGRGSAEIAWRLGRVGEGGAEERLAEDRLTAQAGQRVGLPVAIPVERGFPKPGLYRVAVEAASGGQVLLRQSVELAVRAPLTLRAQAFLAARRLVLTAEADGAAFPASEAELTIALDGPAGRIAERTGPPDPASGAFRLEVGGDQVPPGRLTARAAALRRGTGTELRVERTLDDPLRPPWLGTGEGLGREVPAPWTPLRAGRDDVRCWGRRYRFERSPFPTEVVTRDASVLAGPIRLTGFVGARPLVWRGGRVRWAERAGDRATLTAEAAADGLSLKGTATIEYDGMVRVDVALTPAPGAGPLRDLALEIPLQARHARYLYHFPGQWGSVANSGFLPPQGWTHAFKPYVWLGDEDRGLAWFCESDRNWFPTGAADALSIRREGDVVVLSCRLVRGELPAAGPLEYTFGFQATPVKDPERTVWDYRITHHGNYGLESQTGSLGGTIVYPAAGHLNQAEGTIECWYRPAFPNQERGVPLKDRRITTNRPIVRVRWDSDPMGGTNCGFYWNELVQGPVAWSRRQGKVLLNPGAPMDWTPGQWYHLALTWSDTVRLYVDGRLAAECPNSGFVPEDPGAALIELGGVAPMAAVDELRILARARAPQPDAGPAAPDAETLLWDPFEDYGKAGAETPGKAGFSVGFVPGRFGLAASWEPGVGRTELERLAQAGVRTICFHEHWSPYQSHPYVTEENRPRLKRLAEGCRGAGVGLLLYMSRQFADNAPEWELYSEEVLQTPRSAPYRRKPDQNAYIVCWNSAWRDFCLYHLGRLLDEFGHEGWYLDGPEWPMPCDNPHHGCGYLAPDGSRRPAYDIFATREFMKRLYVLTRQRRPEGQLNIHNSTVMVIPTLAWGTSTWGGEQLDAIKPPVRTLDILPMDAFRTEFMGRQWGIPSEFLVYEGQPYYSRDMEAYTLLHGVLIRPTSDPESLGRSAALWRLYDSFPFKDAVLYPYWANADRIVCAPEGVYATAYERPGEGLLMFVSNLGDAEAEASVTLNLGAFRWTRVTAWDALRGEALPAAGGAIRFPLQAWRYRVLRVRPE